MSEVLNQLRFRFAKFLNNLYKFLDLSFAFPWLFDEIDFRFINIFIIIHFFIGIKLLILKVQLDRPVLVMSSSNILAFIALLSFKFLQLKKICFSIFKFLTYWYYKTPDCILNFLIWIVNQISYLLNFILVQNLFLLWDLIHFLNNKNSSDHRLNILIMRVCISLFVHKMKHRLT